MIVATVTKSRPGQEAELYTYVTASELLGDFQTVPLEQGTGLLVFEVDAIGDTGERRTDLEQQVARRG